MAQAKAGGKSDMNGWTDGVPYTDLEIIKNSYYASSNGTIASYNGWDRTSKYVPCHGASSLSLPLVKNNDYCNWFFDENGNAISKFNFNSESAKTVNVPSNAYTFGISLSSNKLKKAIEDGIIPNAQEDAMRYAKLINAYPTYAPNPIKHDGFWYGNPPGEIYKAKINNN